MIANNISEEPSLRYKILFQSTGFFHTPCEIVVCYSYSIDKTLLHNVLYL